MHRPSADELSGPANSSRNGNLAGPSIEHRSRLALENYIQSSQQLILSMSLNIIATNSQREHNSDQFVNGNNFANLPRITIITPTQNRRLFLEHLLENVRDQNYPNIEHIVVDGDSNDGSYQFLLANTAVTIISEPDENSHDAMNKGLAAASGEIIGFLNSDDTYLPETLLNVGSYFRDFPNAEVVMGRCFITHCSNRNSLDLEIVHSLTEKEFWSELLYGTPGFNSWFFRRKTLDKFIPFDVRLLIAADRYLLIRIALSGIRPMHQLPPSYLYLSHSGSNTLDPNALNSRTILREHLSIADTCLETENIQNSRIRAWRAFEAFRLVITMYRDGNYTEALKLLASAIRRDWLFAFSLVRAEITRKNYRKAIRSYQTR